MIFSQKNPLKHFNIVVTLIVLTLLLSCRSNKSIFDSGLAQYHQPDSISIEIIANNLTEDMSSVSSKNDEVTVLVFEVNDSIKHTDLIYSASFTLTSSSNKKKVAWSNQLDLTGKNISILVIERDTDQNAEEIISSISSKYFEITSFYKTNGNFKIEPLLGDNDIIGIKTLSNFENKNVFNFQFRGYFKLDKYEYLLSLKTY